MPLTKGLVQTTHTKDTLFLPSVIVDNKLSVTGTSFFNNSITANNGLVVLGNTTLSGASTSNLSVLNIINSVNGNAFTVSSPGGNFPNFIVSGSGEQTFRLYNSATSGTTRTSIKLASRLNSDWEWIAYTDLGSTGVNDLTIANLAGTVLSISSLRNSTFSGTIAATGLAGSLLTSTTGAALSASASAGTATVPARADHVHPTTGLGLTASGLNQFAATTSAQLAGVISDETGTGSLVFGTSPTFTDLALIQTNSISSDRGLLVRQSNTGIQGAVINFQKSRGTNVSPTIVATGDIAAAFTFSSYNGTAYTTDTALFGATVSGVSGSTISESLYFIAGTSAANNYVPTILAYHDGRVSMGAGTGNITTGVTAPGAQLQISTTAAGNIGLLVKGFTSQSANLQEWQNSSGAVLAKVDSAGSITAVDLTLSGNLTVNGTTTNINTTNLVVEDKNIILGDVVTPSNTTADGGGITLKGATDKTFNWVNSTGYWTSNIGIEASSFVKTSGTSAQFLKADGSVDSSTYLTTGTASSTYLPLSGGTLTGQIQSTLANSTTTGGGQLYLNGATGNRIDFNQNGISAPTFTTRSVGTKIVLYPNLDADSVDYAIGIDTSTFWQSIPDASAQFKWYAGTTNIATLSSTGSFSAVSKSFDIEHPTKPYMRLRYGSLEGPENGVYVRGNTKENIIELPEVWTGLVDESTITVSLTSIGKFQEVYLEKIENNKIYIGGEVKDISYVVFGERKDIDKLLVEY